ncbi:hypothetical protein MRX96_047228 [Rhipicephalus microplus]
MGLCGSSSAVPLAQSPLVAGAAPLAHWEAGMGGLCGRDRTGLQPLFHYGLNAVGRNLFKEQMTVCLDLVGREALRSSVTERAPCGLLRSWGRNWSALC